MDGVGVAVMDLIGGHQADPGINVIKIKYYPQNPLRFSGRFGSILAR
jgi:hypothetical protein